MAEAAVGKRIKISKIQQHMMLAVLVTSLTFGVSIVFSIFFVKYIAFNSKVIEAKDESISKYYTAIKNVGICTTSNKDGKFSDKDLKNCDPDSIDVTSIPGTLRYNVMVGMTENNDLESVARDSQAICYDSKGLKIDFTELYRNAKTDEERASQLYLLKMCSSLRVIPDALPAVMNDTALLSSMNQIFNLSGIRVESLAPSTAGAMSPIEGIEAIPITVSVEDTAYNTTKLLQNLERSIRSFSFQVASIRWQEDEGLGAKIELQAQAFAFYTNEIEASESTDRIYATPAARKADVTGGDTSTTQTGGNE